MEICCCLQDPQTSSHQGEELGIERLLLTTLSAFREGRDLLRGSHLPHPPSLRPLFHLFTLSPGTGSAERATTTDARPR